MTVSLRPDYREIFRYLGYKGREPDPEVRNAVRECTEQVIKLLEPREVHRCFPAVWDGDEIRIESMVIRSNALRKNLSGCSEVCLMAATIGPGPDRLAARFTAAGQVSRALMVQAAGAQLIESWCDRISEEIRKEASERGFYPRPRFSPGYGDLSIARQEDMFRILNVRNRIGVALTESLLMLPTKSVTAIVGLSETDAHCVPSGCELCNKAESCTFRRV